MDSRDFSKARSSSCSWNVVKVVRFRRCFFFEPCWWLVRQWSSLSLSSSPSPSSSSELPLLLLLLKPSISSLTRRLDLSTKWAMNRYFLHPYKIRTYARGNVPWNAVSCSPVLRDYVASNAATTKLRVGDARRMDFAAAMLAGDNGAHRFWFPR